MDINNKLVEDFKSLEFDSLTDDNILALAKFNFVTVPEDFNLKEGPKGSDGYLSPIPGGLYDGRIFGSIYENKCNCGMITEPNIPCTECGTRALDNIERLIRYGAIDLGVYYTTGIKIGLLVDLLKSNFNLRVDVTDEAISHTASFTRHRAFTLLYLCQLNYDKKSNTIVFTDVLDDINKVGLEGLLAIISKYHPNLLPELERLINRYVPVLPAILRKVKFHIVAGKKKLGLPKSTAYYRSIIMAVNICSEKSKKSKDLYEIAAYNANLRMYAATVLDRMSGLTKSSKQTSIRQGYSINSPHSGRAVIIADPTLPIDTIKIPKVLAYEVYKKDFLKYMKDVRNIAPQVLAPRYNEPDEEVTKMFEEFTKDKVILINRAPTLHAENLQTYKLQLCDDYTIHFPLLTTTAQNADFDGDAVTFYVIPDELKDYMMERSSPAHYTNYASDDSPIIKPRHEILYGLTIATKIIEGKEIKKFNSFSDAKASFDAHEIWVYDTIHVGNRVTSYGREYLANVLGIPELEELIGMDPIDAKNIVAITTLFNTFTPEERVKKWKLVQDFSLEIVTLEGATAISVKDLYYDVPEKYRKRITDLMESDLKETDKIREAEALHGEMIEDMMTDGLKKETIDRIKEGNRGKMGSIVAMLVPAFSIDANKKLSMATNSLVQGLTEEEYKDHSDANRESLLTKAKMVPFGGFLNRQLKEPGSKIVMIKDELDPDNEGLMIPASVAEGRTDMSGKILRKGSKDTMVKVRSLVTTKLKYATPDMFRDSRIFTYDLDGRSFIGTHWMTSFAEVLTQSSLALKHGGINRFVPDSHRLIAPYDTEVTYMEDVIILEAKNEVYIKPTKWSTRGPGFYKKGSLIGEVPEYVTLTINLESIVRLLKAQGSLGHKDMSNDIVFTDCFNRSKPETLTYSSGKVKVGNRSWKRDSRFINRPINSIIEPYGRISTGLQDMDKLNKSSIHTRYNIFRNQLLELREVSEEIVEMVFRIVTFGENEFGGIQRSNTSRNDSALSAIGFGYSKSALTRIVNDDLKINVKDPMSEIIITPMLYKLIDSLNK